MVARARPKLAPDVAVLLKIEEADGGLAIGKLPAPLAGKKKDEKEAYARSLEASGLVRVLAGKLRLVDGGRTRLRDALRAIDEAAEKAAAEKERVAGEKKRRAEETKAVAAAKKSAQAASRALKSIANKPDGVDLLRQMLRELLREVIATDVLPLIRGSAEAAATPAPDLRDAVERGLREIELGGWRGAVPLPRLRQQIQKNGTPVPRDRFQEGLRRLAREFVVDLQVAADPASLPDPEEGIRTDKGLLYYVSLRRT